MSFIDQWKWLVLCLFAASQAEAVAEPVLNEASAATWERAVVRDGVGGDRLGAGPAWFEQGFDGPGWLDGGLPFSFDSGPQDSDLESRMEDVTPTVYMRQEFQVTAGQAASSNAVELEVNARDGYVIFLNGIEVARADLGAPGSWVFHDQRAFFARSRTTETLTLGAASSLLQPGTNLLAVVHANDATDYEYLYDGHSPDKSKIHFDLSMSVGSSSIDVEATPWRYFVGLTEPSGGVIDPADIEGGFVDWIELHNPGGSVANLAGWSLTDEADTLQKWTFPAGVEIAPGGYLIVACTGDDIAAPAAGGLMHTNFSLDDRGEFTALVRPDGTIAGQFDSVPDQDALHSWGVPAGGGAAAFLAPTPGAANSVAAASGRWDKPDPSHQTGAFATSLPTVDLATSAAAGSAVRYTLDGSEPDLTDPVLPAGGLDLDALAPAPAAGVGFALREVWDMPPGTYLSDVPPPTPADTANFVAGIEGATPGIMRFGEQISGLIVAPTTGDYRFYLAANYEGVFFLSDDATTAGLTEICRLTEPVPDRVWDANPDQRSSLITLQAGQSYAFAAHNFSFGYGSGLSIGWLPPGASEPTMVPPSVVRAPAVVPPGVAPPSAPRGVTLRLKTFGAGLLPSKTITRNYVASMAPDQSALASVFLSGDSEEVFFGPNGIFAQVGGSLDWNGIYSVWGPDDKLTDYSMALAFGRAFEKPAMFEVLLPDGSLAGRTGAGLRFSGSAFSRPNYRLGEIDQPYPWTMTWQNKPQMNVFFRGPLGDKTFESGAMLPDSTIDEWNSLRLRAGRSGDNITLTYDAFVRRLFAKQGQPALVSRPANVFLNGRLLSFYLILERPREDWLKSYYDTDTSFTLRVHDSVESGDPDDIDDMFDLVKATDCSTAAGYAILDGLWDLENVADYAILNSYIASGDFIYSSSDQNWVLFRDDRPGGKWRFSVWDAESSFGDEVHDVNTEWTTDVLLDDSRSFANEASIIRTVFRRAYQNDEFRLLFADRVQRAFGPGGALSNAELVANLNAVNAPLAAAQMAWLGTEPNTDPALAWFAAREANVLSEWSGLGLWPSVEAPAASPDGGALSAGATVTLSHSNAGGSIRYTLDGSDPRDAGAATYSSPLSLPNGGTLKARVLDGGDWSPLLEATYAPPPPQLAITELHYNPDGSGDATEFLEIRNLGPTNAALDGAHFIDGITFTFGAVTLAPGERLVLVKDSAAFASAYPAVSIAGQYEGGLSNGGERLELVDAVGNVLIVVDYGDDKDPGWPAGADGKGQSLVLQDDVSWPVATGPAAWRDSFGPPTPGGTDVITFAGDPDADDDGDLLPALIEHAMGNDDGDPSDVIRYLVTASPFAGGGSQCVVELRHDLRAADTVLEVRFSIDQLAWQTLSANSEQDHGDGTVTRTYLCPPGVRGFVELLATAP